jgi:Protein of unknown function (DUF3570)
MNTEKSTALLALTTAALMLQGVSNSAAASSSAENITAFDYRYSHYAEGVIAAENLAGGSTDAERYEIDIHQFSFKTAITEDTSIQISGVQEAMSGASPWYIVSDANNNPIVMMSGATIDEQRSEIGLGFSSMSARTENTLSAGYSTENDYRSLSFGYSGAMNFHNKLTTLSYGINTAKDYIDATDPEHDLIYAVAGNDGVYQPRPTDEIKNRLGMSLGLSRVLTKNTLVNASISYALLDGYLSDTYKLAVIKDLRLTRDARPDSNAQLATNLMLREFFPRLNAALHLDYRFYSNDWEVESHTASISWHQNLGAGWQLIPTARAYEQTAAAFYQPFYTQMRNDGFYSSDYRLSDFSATSGQIKLLKTFEKFSINIAYESYEATGDNPALISYDFYTLGMGWKF